MTDHYVGSIAQPVHLGGQRFSVRVHWAQINGKAVPVGLDLRSFTSKAENLLNLAEDARPVPGGWQPITSPVVRALRVADQVEQSRLDLLAMRDLVSRLDPPRLPAFDEVAKPLHASAAPPKKRPGPKPLLTDEQLRDVVAVAYNRGGANCRRAVRSALSALPVYKGAEPKDLTGAAVAAIRRARAVGLIAPASTRGKGRKASQDPTSGEQSFASEQRST